MSAGVDRRGGPSTAMERRGLIALAILLVVAVTVIAVWRGSSPASPAASVVDQALVAEVDSAARIDASLSGKRQHHKTTRGASSSRKASRKPKAANSPNRRSPLDERPDM